LREGSALENLQLGLMIRTVYEFLVLDFGDLIALLYSVWCVVMNCQNAKVNAYSGSCHEQKGVECEQLVQHASLPERSNMWIPISKIEVLVTVGKPFFFVRELSMTYPVTSL
jgi:hypothetical protein